MKKETLCPLSSIAQLKTYPFLTQGSSLRVGSLKTPWQRLEGWKGQVLSFDGRITMINVILSVIPAYYLSY